MQAETVSLGDRYSRQILFDGVGKEGQRRLSASCAVVIGCGGLGGIVAASLVRAGVGRVRIIDRDLIEYHNLHRQILFDEDDVRNRRPKAIAAERFLKRVNSAVEVEGIVADVICANIERLVGDTNIILDGLDNLEGSLLINDVSLKMKTPWIYGGAIASSGVIMNVIPGETACLRCIYPNISGSELKLTCETVGVIGPAPFVIGSLQAVEALKILVGSEDVNRKFIDINIWKGEFESLKIESILHKNCPACNGKYEFLEGSPPSGFKLL